MSEVIYNALEDKDISLPVYKTDGKNLIMPAFICGLKSREITSRNQEDLIVVDLDFEIHEIAAEKIKEVDIYHEDENGQYNYRAPKEKVAGEVFVGNRIRSGERCKLWKNLTKGSGKMNRILLDLLKSIGVELKTKKIETTDGKKIDAFIIPELNEDTLLGLPVFVWLDQETFTNKGGLNVTVTRVNKMLKMDAVPRVTVLENSMKEAPKTKAAKKDADDPFGDMDDEVPF